jgi:hypothetical protein
LPYSSAFSAEDGSDISSETSVDFQQAAQPYIPEDRTVHNNRCENLKSSKMKTGNWLPRLFRMREIAGAAVAGKAWVSGRLSAILFTVDVMSL